MAGAKKQRQSREKKDPAAPKRPLAPFMFFCAMERPKCRANYPQASIGELGKMLGDKWKTLSARDRNPYEKQALADQDRYRQEKEEYARYLELNPPEPEPVNKKKKKKEKDPNAPKRPLAAFMFFSKQQRPHVKAANPTASIGQIGKLLGDKWNSMSASHKAPFVKQAEADKMRYEQEKTAYQTSFH